MVFRLSSRLGHTGLAKKWLQITIDDVEGFVKVTSHFLDLGHERIGMIMPPVDPNGQSPRVTGFLNPHALRGKKVLPELLVAGG